ncbi:hypothetical protein [Microbacterium sp. 18062]|uniref:hypothetical protein n=1 Tax=Microbacterium sp. 18062 TaxID=2681410 RepID=UPI00135709C8|nr:hypothetical protein [Microbacterium sp. 18062]
MTKTTAFTRSWPSLAAAGAGLIELALAAGVVTGAGGESRAAGPGVLAAALLVLGAASLGWAGTVLARGRIVAPRLGLIGVLAGMGALIGLLVADAAHTSIAAVGAAIALLIVAGLACAHDARRTARTTSHEPRRAVRASALGVLVGATVVAALVTPALASTEAGRLAPDHSEHMVEPTHEH